jgi:DNA-binding GntR family transcriptional regulator
VNLKADDPRAPFMQVADVLRQAIVSGALKSGERLPSTRKLVEQYGVANMTAQNALRVLRDEGLIYSVPGRGSYVREGAAVAAVAAQDTHSPEYTAIMQQLETMTDLIHCLEDRVSQIEEVTRLIEPKAAPKRPRRSGGSPPPVGK